MSHEKKAGAIVKVTPPEEGGNTWTFEQVSHAKTILLANSSTHKRKVECGMGPISLAGYVDTETYEIGVELAVIGINLGQVSGNLRDGVAFKVDLVAVSGVVNIYLKNENSEVWVHDDLKIYFAHAVNDDFKILDI